MNLYRNNLTIGDIPQLDVVVPSFFPRDGLASYWKLDGNSNDAHGSNDGTDYNMTYSAGKIGNAGSFNGGSSRIKLSKNASTYLLNNWTMAAWAKRASSSSGRNSIYQMGNCVLDFGGAKYYDGADRIINDPDIPTDTDWHFYVWTKSSTGGSKLYRDGSLVASQSSHTTDNSNSYTEVNIGRFAAPGNSWFGGSIDELGLWSRALTSDEITKLYNNGNGLTY